MQDISILSGGGILYICKQEKLENCSFATHRVLGAGKNLQDFWKFSPHSPSLNSYKDRSLPPVPAAHPHPKPLCDAWWREWRLAPQPLKEWLEVYDEAKVGKKAATGVQNGGNLAAFNKSALCVRII